MHWYAEAYESLGLGNNTDTTRTIYESACGTGLTMFVNLELLQEQYNITNIEVHGNEYIAEDVITANHFYDLVQEKNNPVNNNLNTHKGRICHGDSTNLSFVPANAFDIVFTGYIDPVVDPLELHLSDRKYSLYCHSESSSKRQELMRKEQALVEDWFALWTRQMIRLAKPGGTIIIESISRPKCEVGDWGGVSPEWWKDVAAKKYGWDAVIDTESIVHMEFEPTRKFKGLHDRYNVKMVKLNPSLS